MADENSSEPGDGQIDDTPPLSDPDASPLAEAGGAGGGNKGRDRDAGADDDEPIGYKRPPKMHRFKPGQSGNPRGRRPRALGTNTLIRKLLNEQVEIVEKGKRRKISLRELNHRRLAEKAAKGDHRAMALLLEYEERVFGFDEEQSDKGGLNPEEQEILDALKARRAAAKALAAKARKDQQPPNDGPVDG
jgi:hypothetical protein